jgi:hypothetical protein
MKLLVAVGLLEATRQSAAAVGKSGFAAFRAESLRLSVNHKHIEAAPPIRMRRSLNQFRVLKERHSLSPRKAATPRLVQPFLNLLAPLNVFT